MKQTLLGRRILVITAHPDDEAFFASGTAWHNYNADGRTMLVCATLGEKGTAHLKKPIARSQLKVLRYRELMRSVKISHFHAVKTLRLPDGGVQDKHWDFLKRTRKLAKKFKPDAILTFGPDGITGHRDHIACWFVGKPIAKQLGVPLYVFTLDKKIAKQAPRYFMASRFNPHYRQIAPYKKPTVVIKVPRAFKSKIMKQYPTQINPKNLYSGMPKSMVNTLLGAEYFSEIRQ